MNNAPMDPRTLAMTRADGMARQRLAAQAISATAYDIAALVARLMKRCEGSADGYHEVEEQSDPGVRAACVCCGLTFPENISDDQLEAARTIIAALRCPECDAGRSGKRSGTHRTVQGVFIKHIFDCGSEVSLTGINRDGRSCVRADE